MRKLALITGGTSGLGFAYAKALAVQGYDLILTGRRKEELKKKGEYLIGIYHIKVFLCIVDFKDQKAFNKFIDFIRTKPIDILINNAGYGLEKSFIEDKLDTQLEMLQVHVNASVTLAHLVANNLIKNKKSGTIINVCSLAAYTPLPTSSMYCGTKGFLINFSKCLAMELKPYSIKVQALCPGFVHTDFHSRLNIPKEACKDKGIITWATPKEVVEESLQALKKDQVFLIPGGLNKLAYQLLKFVPSKVYLEIVSHYSGLFSHKNPN